MVLILKFNNFVCNFWNNCLYFVFLVNVDKNYNLSKDFIFFIELVFNFLIIKLDIFKIK